MRFLQENAADLIVLTILAAAYIPYALYRKKRARGTPGMPSFGGSPFSDLLPGFLRKSRHPVKREAGTPPPRSEPEDKA